MAQVAVNMLWAGSPLGPIHRLSMASFVSAGHPVSLHSYEDVAVPSGVALHDANATMPRAEFEAIRSRRNPSFSTASNGFRMRLLERGAGLWSDADVVCLKAIDMTGEDIFGWESAAYVNTAVLFLGTNSPILRDLRAPFRNWGVPYWLPLRKRMEIRAKRVLRIPCGPGDLRRGTFGPRGLTAVARHLGVIDRAEPIDVFYPLSSAGLPWLFEPGGDIEERITERTRTVHLWNEVLVRDGLQHIRPPATSPLGRLMTRFGID